MRESDPTFLNGPPPSTGGMSATAYVPRGAVELAASVGEATHPRVGVAIIDILDRITDRPTGMPIMRKWGLERYGRYGKRGAQRYVWDCAKDALTSQGVVDEQPSYVVGLRAKKYSMAFGWQNRPRIRVENSVGVREPAGSLCPLGIPAWLAQNVAGAEIDTNAAIRFLLESVGASKETAAGLADRADYNEISQVAAAHAGESAAGYVTSRLVPMWRWQRDGHTWTTRDPSGWRVHTPVSNLPTELRPFLRFGGSSGVPVSGRLAEIDATNSQAVFLAALAHRELKCDETELFAEICGRGQFYEETYMTAYGRYPTRVERTAWKEKVMELWLYANLGCQIGSPVGRAIGARFPRIHKWMGDLKGTHGTAYLPCMMQRAEAQIWIDSLVPRLADLKIPVFTVHDCVIVPAERVNDALGAVSQLYGREGITARFGVKTL